MENKENPLKTPTEELGDPQKAVAYLNAVKLSALTSPGNTRLQIASMHASGHPAPIIADLTGLDTENIVRAVNTAMYPDISVERNLIAYGAGTRNKTTQRSPEYLASVLKSWLLSKNYGERTTACYIAEAADLGLPSVGTIAKTFGGWTKALEELNISAPATSGDYITHTSEGVEKYFLEFLADTPEGKTSIQKYTEWANKKEKCPTWITVIRRSGVKTWNELLTKFGMKPVMVMSSKRSIETHERLVQAVRDYVDATRGGGLSLDDFYGWVDVNLGSGDVEAFKNVIVTKYSSDWVSVLKAAAN